MRSVAPDAGRGPVRLPRPPPAEGPGGDAPELFGADLEPGAGDRQARARCAVRRRGGCDEARTDARSSVAFGGLSLVADARRHPRERLWPVWPRGDPVGSASRISHAGLQYRPQLDLVRRQLRDRGGGVVGRTTSQAGRHGVTEEHMIAATYARLLLALLCLLALATSASAECAWVLWQEWGG